MSFSPKVGSGGRAVNRATALREALARLAAAAVEVDREWGALSQREPPDAREVAVLRALEDAYPARALQGSFEEAAHGFLAWRDAVEAAAAGKSPKAKASKVEVDADTVARLKRAIAEGKSPDEVDGDGFSIVAGIESL